VVKNAQAIQIIALHPLARTLKFAHTVLKVQMIVALDTNANLKLEILQKASA
jgi:hypothetical protein